MVEHGLSLLSRSFTHTPELTDYLKEQTLFWVTLQSLGGDQAPLPSYGRSWLVQMSLGHSPVWRLVSCFCSPESIQEATWAEASAAPVRVGIQQMARWHLSVSMPVATAFSGTLTMVPQGASSVVDLSTFWPIHQKPGCGKETSGIQRFRTTGFIQHQFRLRGVASIGWVPWLCSGYLLCTINFPLKQLKSLPSPGSSSSSVVRATKITDTEAVIDEQKLLTQDKGRESKRSLLIGGFDLTLTSKQHLR